MRTPRMMMLALLALLMAVPLAAAGDDEPGPSEGPLGCDVDTYDDGTPPYEFTPSLAGNYIQVYVGVPVPGKTGTGARIEFQCVMSRIPIDP